MDAFAHLRIAKGRVRLKEYGTGVRIEITGMLVNESITVEVGDCPTIDVKPLSMVQKRDPVNQSAKVQPPVRPSTVPNAPYPAQGIVGLTAPRGYGLGKRNHTNENRWVAEKVSNRAHPWVPTLETGGSCFSLPIWFATKEECEQFIAKEIMGAELS